MIQKYTQQIIQALAYLHDGNENRKTIVHRDIKSSNILLKDVNTAVLCDFGESLLIRNDLSSSIKMSNKPEIEERIGGTMLFMAPESFRKSVLKNATFSDIWSLGCTICEWVSGKNPWEETELVNIHDKEGQIRYMLEHAAELENYIPQCIDELRQMIRKCLRYHPTSRPNATSLLNEPFFNIKFEEDKYVILERNFIMNEINKELNLAIKRVEETKQQQTVYEMSLNEVNLHEISNELSASSSFSNFTDIINASPGSAMDLQELEFNQQVQRQSSFTDSFTSSTNSDKSPNMFN